MEDERKMKFIEYKKLSKKAKKEYNNRNRVLNGFNTGTRSHKDSKHPDRKLLKKELKKLLDNE